MGLYLRPTEIEEAVAALAARPLTILAGGTDFYPARVGKPLSEDILDVTALAALRGISEDERGFRIGAAVRWSELAAAGLPPWFACLALAAREIGGRQIQNAGTLAGNICNASPAADGVPSLLALDAEVEIASSEGTRRLPLAEFILGNRRIALAGNELVTAILISKPRHAARSTFLKLGARKYLVISIVMVAALLERSPDGTIAAARIAVGACSAVARRLAALEQHLIGRRLSLGIGDSVTAAHLAELTPIDDVRAAAVYRSDAALALVARSLEDLAGA
jgi:CO/xanthine dehydrogenase FAD-binding subunit